MNSSLSAGPAEAGPCPDPLNAAQRAAVRTTAPLALCIAGPGSGKTRTLVERIAHLIQSGESAARMAVVTFTNNAADEIRRRLADKLGAEVVLGYAGTLHGLMLRMIEREAEKLGYGKRKLIVLDEEQADALLKQCCKDVCYRGPTAKVKAALRAAVFGNAVWGPAQEQITALRYIKQLRIHGLLTFDTILLEGLKLVSIVAGLPVPFGHLFVDEFQDSSDIDADIYRAIPVKSKFLCGDPDQAVYGWRGGNVQHIVDLGYKAAEVFKLEDNYRSGAAICYAAQALISHNFNRIDKRTISSDSFRSSSVKVRQFDNPLAEMAAVATRIQGAVCEFAVLLRSNALVDEWSTFLQSHGIPIRRKARVERPADWAFVRNAISLFHDPENDWAAAQFIHKAHDWNKARKAEIDAKAKGISINALVLNIPAGIAMAELPEMLGRVGATQESNALVSAIAEGLPPGASLSDLVLAIAEKDAQETADEGSGVTVSTIHGAKGKEFDVCYLPAFEQEIIPGTAKSMDIEECRRLAYVAITRARYEVTISYCKQRKPAFGYKPEPATPSQFIAEAGL